jgi:hypothetical protein
MRSAERSGVGGKLEVTDLLSLMTTKVYIYLTKRYIKPFNLANCGGIQNNVFVSSRKNSSAAREQVVIFGGCAP